MSLEQSSSDANEFKPSAALVDEVRGRFPVGPLLARDYLCYWAATRRKTPQKLQEIMSMPMPEPMWFEYALGTNWRGMKLRGALAPYLRPWYARYLDVGCGFGGCMVAFAKLGMDAHGIEVDPQRAQFARSNLVDHNLPPNATVFNLLEAKSLDGLGKFDLITCIDVIEHVLDVPKTIERMSNLLNPGGLLVLEIPNKNFVPFVAHDGHFDLFAITQLARTDAIAYHKAHFDFEYDVGDYYELEHYFSLLSANGCEPRTIDSSLHPALPLEEFAPKLALLEQTFAQFEARSTFRGTAALRNEIISRYKAFLERVKSDHAKLSDAKSKELFAVRYLTDFWTVIAKKIQ